MWPAGNAPAFIDAVFKTKPRLRAPKCPGKLKANYFIVVQSCTEVVQKLYRVVQKLYRSCTELYRSCTELYTELPPFLCSIFEHVLPHCCHHHRTLVSPRFSPHCCHHHSPTTVRLPLPPPPYTPAPVPHVPGGASHGEHDRHVPSFGAPGEKCIGERGSAADGR